MTMDLHGSMITIKAYNNSKNKRTMNKIKFLLMAMMAVVAMTFASCGSDDDTNESGSGNSSIDNVLSIDGTNYGKLEYACFIENGDGTSSLMFSNQNLASGNVNTNGNLTFLSVRIPSVTDIPTGTFSKDIDADFDVNRNLSTQKCDLTGWSLNLVMTIAKSGSKYIVDVTSSDFHIYKGDDEIGDGQKGSVMMHYEGAISLIK